MTRLVVFELHHLGDAVMALPFLRAASSLYETSVVCRPPVAALLREITRGIGIQEISESWGTRATMARKLGLSTEDATACVWADSRAQGLMRLSGAGRRVGFPMTRENYYAPDLPWRNRRLRAGQFLSATAHLLSGGPLLTDPLQRRSPSQSHLESWTQLAAALGFVPNFDLPWISSRSPSLPGGVEAFLRSQGDGPVLLIHPGGRLPTKRWPYFQALLERLASGAPVATVIVQPPGEEALRSCGDHQLVVTTPDLGPLLALFQASHTVLCNDSLPSHLAAALGKRVVTIFGSGAPAWFAPYGNASRVIATDICRFRPSISWKAV